MDVLGVTFFAYVFMFFKGEDRFSCGFVRSLPSVS